MKTPLIGICGKSGCGKDTIAEFLVGQHGFVRIAVADPLKHVAALAFTLTHEQLWGAGRNVVDPHWAQTPRQIYQQLGDALRVIHPDALTRAWEAAVSDAVSSGHRVVVPDIRMPEEARWLHKAGGVLWRIERPGLQAPPGGEHATETALDCWPVDWTVINDADVEQMLLQVTRMIDQPLDT